jgi:L-lactate dehydrogenase complex protein LldF
MNQHDQFIQDAEKKTFDLEHRRKINFNANRYTSAVEQGASQFEDHDLARQRAAYLKTQVIENLDKYLIEFEQKFLRNGGKIIWARTKEDALKELQLIFNEKKARSAVKSKTMTADEIQLTDFMEQYGIETTETDLGEYIVQLAGQKPYHMVTPAMHFSKKDVSNLFHQKLNSPHTDDISELAQIARRVIREKYLEADIAITGANFLIADIGAIAITENEGNVRLSTTFPKTHIAIVGIEKLIPTMDDLALFWPMLAHSGTGQQLTAYNTILTGPRKPTEPDGPDEMYLVLLDNGRTKLLQDAEKRQALNCIRCGACLNVCPVYKNIGGQSYGSSYNGPIGAVITPHYEGMEKFKHLSYASTLCGACTSVCPVKIDLHNLLLLNRQQSVEEGYSPGGEKRAYKLWKMAMLKRGYMNLLGKGLKNFFLNYMFGEGWGKRRELPKVAPKSFNELWKEKEKEKTKN